MEKKDLLEIIVKNFKDRNGKKIFKEDARHIVKIVFEAIKMAIVEDTEVKIQGFGSFKPITRKGRQWSLPEKDSNGNYTGETKTGISSDKKTISFGVSKTFESSLQ